MKRLGIVGAGQIAQAHLRAWAELDEIEVVAVCDATSMRLRVRKQYSDSAFRAPSLTSASF